MTQGHGNYHPLVMDELAPAVGHGGAIAVGYQEGGGSIGLDNLLHEAPAQLWPRSRNRAVSQIALDLHLR